MSRCVSERFKLQYRSPARKGAMPGNLLEQAAP